MAHLRTRGGPADGAALLPVLIWGDGRTGFEQAKISHELGVEGTQMQDHLGELGKIFIAGTGRSGTTVLPEFFGKHPDVWLVPYESKFIVESDGISTLIPLLCERYSVTASHLALARFIDYMRVRIPLKTATEEWELDCQFDKLIGEDSYYPPLDAFEAAITDYKLNGTPIPKHFSRRAELIALARTLVSEMFGRPTLSAGKSVWVEKTPSNIVAMDLLWELFPEATIVHIKRDPRGVVHSFMKQDWAPATLPEATSFVATIYWRWLMLRRRLDLGGRRYLEIKLEDFARSPEEYVPQIAAMTGLSAAQFDVRGLWPRVVSNWQTEMPKASQAYCERKLARYFDLMGYSI
jgi:hypothetical protein